MQVLVAKLKWLIKIFAIWHAVKVNNLRCKQIGVESLYFCLHSTCNEMATNVLINASLVPASEILYETIIAIFETIDSTKSVLIQKENFDKFSTFLERIIFFLREFSKLDTKSSDSLKNAVEILNGEIKVAKQLAQNCSNRNKIYLLINCRKIVEQLQGCTEKISQALGLISLASLDGSLVINDEISKLCKNMSDIEYSMTLAEEEILAKIESGIEERNVDRSYANDLLICMAEAVGISTEQTELKREFEALKSEMDNDELREDMTEPLQMEQIIVLLSKADMITTPEEKEIRYLNKRDSLGRQQLEPLQSFYCPITGDIMVDPVETSSGHTFERSAIEKWLEEGKDRCPITNIPLKISLLRSNKTLRESIEEWKDRNTMIMIASMKLKIQSNTEQEALHSLGKLQELCRERELHREWIIMEDYIPILIGLLAVKNLEIRKRALDILCILAKDKDDNKVFLTLFLADYDHFSF